MTDNYNIDKDTTDTDMDTEIFGGDDFVLTRTQGGKFVGGGFKINSSFLQGGQPIMTTYNEFNQSGGKISSPFENLAVPAGLFYVNMRIPKKESNIESDEHYKDHKMAPDDIIDKLYALVEVDKKRKRKTRKHTHKLDKTKTRKHK